MGRNNRKTGGKVRRLLMVITTVITFQLMPVSAGAQQALPDTLKTVLGSLPDTIPDDIPDLVPDTIPDLEKEIEAIMERDGAVVIDVAEPGATLMAGQVAPVKQRRDWSKWAPNPKRALWLALVIPGGGQIYNRKYWKLPIVYGGFIGCLYAMNWNNTMYKDYSQAYIDLVDKDPNTKSYNLFLHLGTQIDDSNKKYYEDIFRKRKDRFRRWRDLSFFVLLGVYALSVIDAYVDAELSNFDISKDLSLKVEPTILNNRSSSNPLDSSSLGLQCSLNF